MLAEASTADVADEGGVGGVLQDSDLDIAEEQEELPPEPITQPTTIINVIPLADFVRVFAITMEVLSICQPMSADVLRRELFERLGILEEETTDADEDV